MPYKVAGQVESCGPPTAKLPVMTKVGPLPCDRCGALKPVTSYGTKGVSPCENLCLSCAKLRVNAPREAKARDEAERREDRQRLWQVVRLGVAVGAVAGVVAKVVASLLGVIL